MKISPTVTWARPSPSRRYAGTNALTAPRPRPPAATVPAAMIVSVLRRSTAALSPPGVPPRRPSPDAAGPSRRRAETSRPPAAIGTAVTSRAARQPQRTMISEATSGITSVPTLPPVVCQPSTVPPRSGKRLVSTALPTGCCGDETTPPISCPRPKTAYVGATASRTVLAASRRF